MKIIKSLNGSVELNTPRDREGTFSPKLANSLKEGWIKS